MQSLAKLTVDKRGEVLAREGGEEREVVEYLVIEKKYDKGVESAWCVWGTTEETGGLLSSCFFFSYWDEC